MPDSDVSAQQAITTSSTASTADPANESGCENFDPVSGPLNVGASDIVEVEVVDGLWSELDFAGNYWVTDEPVPPGADESVLIGSATLVEAVIDGTGLIHSGRVEVDFGEEGEVVFDGPIFCD